MRKFFNIVLTLSLLSFSFYYSRVVSNYLKNKDPIMIKIKEASKDLRQEPIDAIINKNTIIPGLSGIRVNLDKSYLKMKKINSYSENLLVFDYIKPKVSLENNQDKLIIQGNPFHKNISILVKTNDLSLLQEALEKFKNPDINLILTNSFIKANKDYLKTLKNNIVTSVSNNLDSLVDYCYQTTLEGSVAKNKKTVLTTLITHDYYYNTYQSLASGQILSYQLLSEKNIEELLILISGIKNLNYNIVSLDTLLKE